MQTEPSAAAADAQPAVLFVDDEPQSVKYFARAFGADFPVLTATSVAEAEAVLQAHAGRIGVLVTDQRMPVETGVELLDRTKERYPHIVRVLTSAYADMDDAVAAVNSGWVHRYVLKPWDIEALRGDLRAAMELHHRRRHEQALLQAKRRTMTTLAAHVAHEVSTPLATIRMMAAGLEEHLAALLRAYRQAAATNDALAVPTEALAVLDSAPATIRTLAERAGVMMDLMLMNAREEATDAGHYQWFSIAKCVGDALASYGFAPGERELVDLSGEDFEVWGSEVLTTFVVYNLLKNALYAVRAARKGAVRIRIAPGRSANRLLVRDTGKGIAAETLPRIFEDFFTGHGARSGTGMGLPFCRRVMTACGGSIDCRSVEGEFTELELRFPPRTHGPAGDDARGETTG